MLPPMTLVVVARQKVFFEIGDVVIVQPSHRYNARDGDVLAIVRIVGPGEHRERAVTVGFRFGDVGGFDPCADAGLDGLYCVRITAERVNDIKVHGDVAILSSEQKAARGWLRMSRDGCIQVDVCDELIAIGERTRIIMDAAKKAGFSSKSMHWFPEAPASIPFLQTHLTKGDSALVKGSLGMGMSRIVAALEASND